MTNAYVKMSCSTTALEWRFYCRPGMAVDICLFSASCIQDVLLANELAVWKFEYRLKRIVYCFLQPGYNCCIINNTQWKAVKIPSEPEDHHIL